MKIIIAVLIAISLLAITMSGCSEQAKTTTATPTATAQVVQSTIGPTDSAIVQTELTEDTTYNKDAFGVAIPKGAKFYNSGMQYIWLIGSSEYVVQVQIAMLVASTSIKTSYFTGSDTALGSFIDSMETSSNNLITIDDGYKNTTVDGKTAVLLTGKVNASSSNASTIDVYLVDSSKGLIVITIMKIHNGSNTTAEKEMNATATNIFNTIKIK